MNLHLIVLAPAEAVRDVFRNYGFTGIRSRDEEVFVLGIPNQHDQQDRPALMLSVPAELLPDGQFRIDAAKVSFAGHEKVTLSVKRKAWQLLRQLFSLIDHQVHRASSHASYMN